MNAEVQEQLQAFMENIAHLRKQYGLSKKEMAEILGIGVKTLDKIERGELPKRISTHVIFRIQDHFCIPPSKQFHKLSH